MWEKSFTLQTDQNVGDTFELFHHFQPLQSILISLVQAADYTAVVFTYRFRDCASCHYLILVGVTQQNYIYSRDFAWGGVYNRMFGTGFYQS